MAWAASGSSLDTRFFIDDSLWREAPILTGQGSWDPLPSVRNILVTGGEGFIASWLVRHLVTKYPSAYRIVSFDKLDYCSSRNNSRLLSDRPNFHFFHGDVTNELDVLKCLRMYDIDTVFHLAAQTHVDLSFRNSFRFTVNNVLGTHVLLQSVVSVGTVKRFFHISTDEVYGEVGLDAADLKEHTRSDPTNPYAASKAAAEAFVQAYAKSFKLPAVIIRLNNVYGPHQYPEKVIPKFLNLLHRRMPLFIHGDGKHTRRYLYAGDAADAFDTILHRGEMGQTYNVDSRDELSNLALARKLLKLFGLEDEGGRGPDGDRASGGDTRWIRHTRDRDFNDLRYAVDGTKLRELGWKQRVSFDDGLSITSEWYARFSGWWGSIDNTLLSPFPVVLDQKVVSPEESLKMEKLVDREPSELAQADGGAMSTGDAANGHTVSKANGVAHSNGVRTRA